MWDSKSLYWSSQTGLRWCMYFAFMIQAASQKYVPHTFTVGRLLMDSTHIQFCFFPRLYTCSPVKCFPQILWTSRLSCCPFVRVMFLSDEFQDVQYWATFSFPRHVSFIWVNFTLIFTLYPRYLISCPINYISDRFCFILVIGLKGILKYLSASPSASVKYIV